VCGALADAVRRESAQAVAYWWGVTAQTVMRWRKALDVGPTTEGTHQLRSDYALEPAGAAVREMAKQAKAKDPESRAKIAAAKKGKPRPPQVGEAVAATHRGTKHAADTRAKMSEAHRLILLRPAPPVAGADDTALPRRGGEVSLNYDRPLVTNRALRRKVSAQVPISKASFPRERVCDEVCAFGYLRGGADSCCWIRPKQR
jgi:hypothetical protein